MSDPKPTIGLVGLNLLYAAHALEAAEELLHSSATGNVSDFEKAVGIVACVTEMLKAGNRMTEEIQCPSDA